jgi:ABC-type dipeptide/oligopeptide/nickel transport system permease component
LGILLIPVVLLCVVDGFAHECLETVRREARALREVDYVLEAEARGERTLPHLLRGIAVPVLGVIGGRSTYLLSTAIVIEQMFEIKGLGYASWMAIGRKDYFLILALTLGIAVLVRAVRITTTALGLVLDPRLRYVGRDSL